MGLRGFGGLLVAVLAAIATATAVRGDGGDTSLIHACQRSSASGKVKMRFVTPPTACSNGYTPVHWPKAPLSAPLVPPAPCAPGESLTWDGASFVCEGPQDISVRVFNSVTPTINSNTPTVLTWDTERFDTDNLHTGASSQLVAPVTGKYHVFATLYWNNVAGGIRSVMIRRNGNGGLIVAGQTIPASTDPSGVYESASGVIDLQANDFVECLVYQDTGAGLYVQGAPGTVSGGYGAVSSEFGMAKLP